MGVVTWEGTGEVSVGRLRGLKGWSGACAVGQKQWEGAGRDGIKGNGRCEVRGMTWLWGLWARKSCVVVGTVVGGTLWL